MPRVTNGECITASGFVVTRVNHKTNAIVMHHDTFGSLTAVVGKTLTNRPDGEDMGFCVPQVFVNDTALVTMTLQLDKKTLYCVQASILVSAHRSLVVWMKPAHNAVNSIDGYCSSFTKTVMNSRGCTDDGSYVGLGNMIASINEQSAVFHADEYDARKSINSTKRSPVSTDNAGPAKRSKSQADGATTTAAANERPQLTMLVPLSNITEPIIEADPLKAKLMEQMGRMKKAFLSSTQLLQEMANVDAELLREILQ